MLTMDTMIIFPACREEHILSDAFGFGKTMYWYDGKIITGHCYVMVLMNKTSKCQFDGSSDCVQLIL